jgi:hypothetical protein
MAKKEINFLLQIIKIKQYTGVTVSILVSLPGPPPYVSTDILLGLGISNGVSTIHASTVIRTPLYDSPYVLTHLFVLLG